MQSYKFTSTFYFIVYVCEHWCCGQLLRWSRALAAVALSPWAWEAAAYVLPLLITEPHWPRALGRPGLGRRRPWGAAVAAPAAPSTAPAPITGVTGHIVTREFIQTSFLLYVYYDSITWLLTIYFLFPAMVQYFVILFKLVHFCARISSVLLGIQKT